MTMLISPLCAAVLLELPGFCNASRLFLEERQGWSIIQTLCFRSEKAKHLAEEENW